MRRLFRPRIWREVFRQWRTVRKHGGARRIHVRDVSEPEGILAPASQVTLDVEAKDGSKSTIEAPVPIAWPWAIAYRLGKRLNIPVLRRLDPGRIRFSVPVPGR